MKELHFGKERLEKVMKGFDAAAQAVIGTIGPKGGNVFIDNGMEPSITNDGHTIASNTSFTDKLENEGAYVIKNAAGQQNDDVGDGTTTVTVLTHSTVHESLARPENPMTIRESLKAAGEKVLKILAKKSVKIDKKDIEKVALISAEDKTIAKLITEIIHKLGEKAVINVEDSKTFSSDYEIVDGYEAQVGYLSAHFINNQKTSQAVFENVRVLVSEKKLSNLQDIAPLFEMLGKEKVGQLVIFCEDIDDSILGILVGNKLAGRFNSLVIRANGPLLQDIEGVVGATAVSDSRAVTFSNLKMEHLGHADKIVCNTNKTIILTDGKASKVRALEMESRAENEPNMYTAQTFKKRAAKLRGGIAVLRIGAPTDLERIYLRRKAEDAVKASLAALEEGVVEGGGMTLWRIAQEMKPKTIGEEILKKSLVQPLRKIIENCGKDYTEVVMNLPEGMGYDARNDKYVDMQKEGIIDPSKVERMAVENSISAASTFITTFCSLVDAKEEKNK